MPVYPGPPSGRTRTYNPSVNSRIACSRLTLQTRHLDAGIRGFSVIWGDSGGTSSTMVRYRKPLHPIEQRFSYCAKSTNFSGCPAANEATPPVPSWPVSFDEVAYHRRGHRASVRLRCPRAIRDCGGPAPIADRLILTVPGVCAGQPDISICRVRRWCEPCGNPAVRGQCSRRDVLRRFDFRLKERQ